MGQLFACLMVFIFIANTCFASALELSDIIKTAREVEMTKVAETKSSENSIQPIKNSNIQNNTEQNTCEKINTKEFSKCK